MTFGSVCSGIEAASIAWNPLGWEAAFFAEVEPFCRSVLDHHYPGVPNLGDMTRINGAEWRGKLDVLVGGTPCQSFSIAGLRKSMDDERGNLTLKFVELTHAIDPRFTVWKTSLEFSAPKTTLLDAISPAWWERMPPSFHQNNTTDGASDSSSRNVRKSASRTAGTQKSRKGTSHGQTRVWLLDQSERPRGEFSMLSTSIWPSEGSGCSSLADVLEKGPIPEQYYLSRKACAGILRRAEKRGKELPPQLKAALEEVAHADLPTSLGRLAHILRAEVDSEPTSILGGGIQPHRRSQVAAEELAVQERAGDRIRSSRSSIPDVAMALNAKGGSGRIDGESETFVTAPLTGNPYGDHESRESLLIAHSLRADGFDASEDGTGRGTPLVAVPILEAGARTGKSTDDLRAGSGIGDAGDPMFTLQSGKQHAVFSVGLGSDPLYATDVAQPSTGRNGDPGCIAFDTTQITSRANRSVPKPGNPCHPLASGAHAPAIAFGMDGGGAGVPTVFNLRGREGGAMPEVSDVASLRSSSGGSSRSYVSQMAVRRLLPRECCKLQGFSPTYFDNVKYRGKKPADGPIYKALGNSMASNCMSWIGQRIDKACAAEPMPTVEEETSTRELSSGEANA